MTAMTQTNHAIHLSRVRVVSDSCLSSLRPGDDGSVRHTTNKHHITDAVKIWLLGYYESIAAQSQMLTRLSNQKPDEVVEWHFSTATTYQQTQLAIDTKCR
jgi:hypothetical protein